MLGSPLPTPSAAKLPSPIMHHARLAQAGGNRITGPSHLSAMPWRLYLFSFPSNNQPADANEARAVAVTYPNGKGIKETGPAMPAPLYRAVLRRHVDQLRQLPCRRTHFTKSDLSSKPKTPQTEGQVPTPNNVPTLPFWQRLGPLTRAAEAFARSQRKRPYITQLCSSLVIYLISDSMRPLYPRRGVAGRGRGGLSVAATANSW